MRTNRSTTVLGVTLYTHLAAKGDAVFAMAAFRGRSKSVDTQTLSMKIRTS